MDIPVHPEIGTYLERVNRKHQVQLLEDDIANEWWEKAHLSLFLTEERPGTRWYNLLKRANAAYHRGDRERFNIILSEMKDAITKKTTNEKES